MFAASNSLALWEHRRVYVSYSEPAAGDRTESVEVESSAGAAIAVLAPQAAPTPPFAGARVLVVDDEELVGTMLNMILKRFGCEVLVARAGSEAIDRLRSEENIALVLLDVRMPGLDGPATLQIMRSIKPAVHCCFMTGDIGKYTEQDLLSQGVLSILKKPFRLADIAQVLRKAGITSGMADEQVLHAFP